MEIRVLVGGAAPAALKQEIVDELVRVLYGTDIPVRIASSFDNLDGDSLSNIVNRLTANGHNGVQREQFVDARDRFWKKIAQAVASVYRSKVT
jgi:phage replication-related protein YjqB (UPF0714/DUF867 family)